MRGGGAATLDGAIPSIRITQREKPKGVYAHASLNYKTEREHARLIVNENPLNLEKTTSSVHSVLLLIYAYEILNIFNENL